jgi:AraC-like DNA-binding protein
MEQKSPSLLHRSAAERRQKGGSPAADRALGLDDAARIRDGWSHAVASALQPVVGEILDVDVETFAEPFNRLADRTPPPANVAERRELKARFVEFTLRLGTDFHTWFHRTTPLPCVFPPIESAARIWFDSQTDPRRLLTQWASTYAAAFARHHPLPPAWKAARLLRTRAAQRADIRGVARAVGASRSTLDENFNRTFGMAPSVYHARLRVTHGLTELRDRGIKVEHAARLAGFGSVKNFNRAVRRCSAMTPSQVRRLAPADFARLLQQELQTDTAALARAKSQEPRAKSQENALTSTAAVSRSTQG